MTMYAALSRRTTYHCCSGCTSAAALAVSRPSLTGQYSEHYNKLFWCAGQYAQSGCMHKELTGLLPSIANRKELAGLCLVCSGRCSTAARGMSATGSAMMSCLVTQTLSACASPASMSRTRDASPQSAERKQLRNCSR
jgi:hypothetical protein